jgi:hypothetical protein
MAAAVLADTLATEAMAAADKTTHMQDLYLTQDQVEAVVAAQVEPEDQ